MFIFIAILALSVIVPVFHLLIRRKRRSAFQLVEIFLLYQLVFNLGILGLLSFFGLTFMPITAANYNGWPSGPFQQEMANVNLGFATLGILSIWIRKHFWTAIVIGASIWLFADGINHLVHMLYYKNFSPGNTGILLYSDLLLPVVWLVLLYYYLKLKKNRA